mgnify:CR=1 FL=1
MNKADFKFQSIILKWYIENGRNFVWRETRDPYKILVAEIVLKQTGAWKAEKAFHQIIELYKSVEELSLANNSKLNEIIKPLGLTERSKLLVEISKDIINRFEGKIPDNYEQLISIKGVGQYTANAILCLAYEERHPLVDGSVKRVLQRVFGYDSSKPAYADKDLWQMAFNLLPYRSYRDYNLGLIDFGALVCKHLKPNCVDCPLKDLCYHQQKLQKI